MRERVLSWYRELRNPGVIGPEEGAWMGDPIEITEIIAENALFQQMIENLKFQVRNRESKLYQVENHIDFALLKIRSNAAKLELHTALKTIRGLA